MFNKVIKFSIDNKFFIGLLVIALILTGIYCARRVPLDAVPDITNNQVQIATTSTSLAPEEVERLLTYPVEVAMANIPGVKEIRSISRYGLSLVTVVFEENINILKARQFVFEQIADSKEQIPKGLGDPQVIPITTGLGEIYQYVLTVDPKFKHKYSLTDLRTLQDWVVKRQLSGTKGVIEVSTFGGKLKQYEVAVKPSLLRNYGVSIQDVFLALEKNNQNVGGSYIEKLNSAYYIRVLGMVTDIYDIEKIVVTNKNETPILVGDLAEVRIGSAPRFGAMTMDGKGEVVGGITLMYKGENSSQVIKNIKKRMDQIQKSLPEGVSVYAYLDRSELVDKTIGTVTKNLIEGALIVIFVLVLLLGNLRAGLIVASVIPLSLLFAFSLMNIFGVSANLMSLGAIDFGLVVDGSIIVVEAVLHRLYSGKNRLLSQRELNDQIYESSSKIRKSAAFGEIIILIVYLPILALVGIEGKMFSPMAKTVSFAILGALILSLTYVPMMCSLFLKKNIVIKETFSDKIVAKIKELYAPILCYFYNHGLTVVLSTIIVFGITIIGFIRMGGEFVPTLKEGDLALQASIQPGSSLTESIETTTKIEKVLLENFPQVKHVVSKIGASEVPTDPMGIENFDIMIIMSPEYKWKSSNQNKVIVSQMKEKLESIVGVSFEVTQPIQLRFNELISGAKTDIAIKLYGENAKELSIYAKDIAQAIDGVSGVADLAVEQTEGFPQLVINYDRDKLASYGVSISDVNQIIKLAYAGEIASAVFEDERKFDLVVRLHPDYKTDVSLNDLFVKIRTGEQVPVSELAMVSYQRGANQISRENARRLITIGVNARDRDIESLVNDIKRQIDTRVDLPVGYFVNYGGQFENLSEAKSRLGVAVPVALALIILLLYITFGSFKHAILIFTAVPLSAIGAVASLYLRGMPFSISAGVGFIALFGVAVLNGIVLISYFNNLKNDYPDMSIEEIVFHGAMVRMRPVLLTALVASLGFLPMAISTTAGSEVQKPLATVVIGGLITSTVLTLLVLPILYSMIESKKLKLPKISKNNFLFLALICFPYLINAQDKKAIIISQDLAIEMGLKEAASYQNALRELEKEKTAIPLSWDLNRMTVTYNETGERYVVPQREWVISQNFGSIATNIQKAKEFRARISMAKASLKIERAKLIRDVKKTYNKWVNLHAQYKLVEKQLEINNNILSISKSYLEEGEIGGLENDLNQLQSIRFLSDKSRVLTSLEEVKRDLKTLIGIEGEILPSIDDPVYLTKESQQWNLARHFIELYESHNRLAQISVKTVKSLYFPEFIAEYKNQKNEGVPISTGVTFGVTIPVSIWSNKAKVKDKTILKDQILIETKAMQLKQENDLSSLLTQFEVYRDQLQKMEQNVIVKAKAFLDKIQLAYSQGEIDAFQFTQSFQTYYDVKMNYYQVLDIYNQIVISIDYLTKEQ